MNESEFNIQQFWQAYLKWQDDPALDPDVLPEAWSFGDTPEMADELGQLVLRGTKTATCGLLWEHEDEDEPLPRAGQLSIVLDGAGRPLCLIETTEVQIRAYDQVDPQFAYEEGEGDRSLEYCRQAHWRFFGQVCDHIGRTLDPAMPLVCERFRLLFPIVTSGITDPMPD